VSVENGTPSHLNRSPAAPRALAAALLTASALACSPEARLAEIAGSPETRFAEESYAMLARRDFDGLAPRFSEELRNADTRARLEKMAELIPAGSHRSRKLVGHQSRTFNGNHQVNATLEYEYASFLLFNAVVFSTRDGSFRLKSMRVQPMADSLERLNAFGLRGKSFVHYATLVLAPAVALFILTVVVVCVRTKIPRRKWLWVSFVLVGVGQFQLNWTTGQTAVRPLSFRLMGAGARATGPYAPWILSVSFPLGAVVFLARRRSWTRPEDRAETVGEVFR
jgi:hypothetical protein